MKKNNLFLALTVMVLAGCSHSQNPVTRVYIEDDGGGARLNGANPHGAPQIDISQMPRDSITYHANGDPGVGEGSTEEISVHGPPFRIILIPTTMP